MFVIFYVIIILIIICVFTLCNLRYFLNFYILHSMLFKLKQITATSRPFVNHLMVCFMRVNKRINLIKKSTANFFNSSSQILFFVHNFVRSQISFESIFYHVVSLHKHFVVPAKFLKNIDAV